METINTPLRTTLVLHCYSRADRIENEQAPAVQEELKSLVASGILEPQQPVPHYKLTPRGLDFVETLLATPFPARLAPAPEETVDDWKCHHCGSTKGTWFSRVEPMGDICEDCGKSVDEEPVSEFACSHCEDRKWVAGSVCGECPAPEEPVSKCNCRSCVRDRKETINGLPAENFRMIVCSKCGNKRCPKAENCKFKCTESNALDQIGELEEPAPEWRELGVDEVICEGDEIQPKHHDPVHGLWCSVFEFEIGTPTSHHGYARYRTRRPLPKQEEMPLEDEPIEPLFDEEITLIEKWGCSKDPFRSVHAQEAFVHVIHALRCLDNEIQQHEDMFTTWIKATEDQRREIRYLRDEIQKLKEAR